MVSLNLKNAIQVGKYMAIYLTLFLFLVYAQTRHIKTLNSTGEFPHFRVKVYVVEISRGLQVFAEVI